MTLPSATDTLNTAADPLATDTTVLRAQLKFGAPPHAIRRTLVRVVGHLLAIEQAAPVLRQALEEYEGEKG